MTLQSLFASIASLTEAAKSLPWHAYEEDALIILHEIEASDLVPVTMKPSLIGAIHALKLLEQITPLTPLEGTR
jgi:hypothetical protein